MSDGRCSVGLLGILALVACAPGGVVTVDSADPVIDSASDIDSGTDTGTATDSTTDTATAILDAQAALHPEMNLVIDVTWALAEDGTSGVEYRVSGEETWRETPAVDGVGPHEMPLLGLPASETIAWRVVAELGGVRQEGLTGEVETGPLPVAIGSTSLLSSGDLLGMSPYVMGTSSITTSFDQWFLYVLDRDGDLVWYRLLDDGFWSPNLKRDVDGRSFWFGKAPWGGGDSWIVRMDMTGRVIEEIEAQGLSHSFTLWPDGSLAWPSTMRKTEQVLERSPDGEVRTVWTCADWLLGVGLENTRCDHNALVADPDTGTYLASYWNLDTVVEFDRETRETQRHIGQLQDAYAFDPPESEFNWQHNPSRPGPDRLLLTSTWHDDAETIVWEYEIDASSETLRAVWSYGQGEGVMAEQVGEARRLDNGNTLMNFGTSARVQEIDVSGELLWDVQFNGGSVLGEMLAVDDLYAMFCPDCVVEPDGEPG